MPSRSARPRKHDPAAPDPSDADSGGDGDGREPDAPQAAIPDLSALPIAGIGRRQLVLILGAVATIWMVVLFARQIGDASAASTRAEDLAAANETLRDDIEGYRRELALIQRQEYILIQARGYGLGKGREIPFSLAPDAPSLPPDAPGSASVRVGSDAGQATPFERWMELLFGPG
jgi:cell division protein FtsB